MSVTSAGATVTGVDANDNGWRMFFNSAYGGTISQSGVVDNGVYTELEAQNTVHGRIEMYYQTSGGTWIGDFQNPATITILRDTPQLVVLTTNTTNSAYHLQWTTTYVIWPDGQVYVQLQTSNTGTKALALSGYSSLEIDLGGFPLTYYSDTSAHAWYVVNGVAKTPIPTNTTNVEAQLFGHMPDSTTQSDLGYLMDKYTTWSAQGATSQGIADTQNSYRLKDKWLGGLSSLNPGQTLTFLFLLDQRRSLTAAESAARDADYRAPAVTVADGTLATSDTEPSRATLVNGFNMNLGAYVIAANTDHINAQFGFPSAVSTRFAPRFKITGWTGYTPTVTWGDELLTSGTDYTYTLDAATNTLYLQLAFDVVPANATAGQRVNAPIDIS